MNIRRTENKIGLFIVDKDDDTARHQGAFVLVELNGSGCGLEKCNCSPSNFITICDGSTGLVVALTDEEAENIKKDGFVEIVDV